MNSQLAAAYAVCRHLTRSAAKNFYYGFLVLPRERRNALSAVYAFMRHCDDLCDVPGLSTAARRQKLDAWGDSLHRAIAGEPSDDPVLLALADTQRRFNIPLELFDKLVVGTAMDLQPEGAPVRYKTFSDLERYCYHVASVVGLITIKIFGYRDPAAEPLAVRTGLAFQLTNIIRDVKEDAMMGRIYIPLADLAIYNRSPEELTFAAMSNGFKPARLRPVLRYEARRARQYYRAADELIPLIDEECRPALWVLVEIYRRLLDKIARRKYNVFGSRIRLTLPEKLAIVSKGFWRRLT